MMANPKKCVLVGRETKYLGFLVGQGIIRPLTDKVKAIRRFQAPCTQRQMSSFSGLINYYRQFIPNIVELMAPLTDTLWGRLMGAIVWSPNMVKILKKLKTTLCRDMLAHTPDFSAPFIL